MKLLHEQVIGGIVIAVLVAAGLLMSEESELPRWWSGPFVSQPLKSVTVNHIDWSADGRRMLCLSRGGKNAMQSLLIYEMEDATAMTPSWCNALDGAICDASMSSDGTSVVVATHSGELWWVDLETSDATELVRLDAETPFLATAISSDGRWIAGVACDGVVYLCDPAHGDATSWSTGSSQIVSQLRFSSDGSQLLCSRTDGSIFVWDTATRRQLAKLSGRGTTTVADFLPNSNQIVCFPHDDSIQTWNSITGARREFGTPGIRGQIGKLTLDVASTGLLAAWGNEMDTRIVVWDLVNQRKKLEIVHPSVVIHLAFSSDGQQLGVCGCEGVVRIYDMRNGTEIRTIDIGRLMAGGSRT